MDEELHQLCKEVSGMFPEWNDTKEIVRKYSLKGEPQIMWRPPEGMDLLMTAGSVEWEIPLYTSDYLLEKLPEEVKKRVLVVTNGDRPHAGYAERDNYGNYTLDEHYWKNAQYSNEVRKALLKLTIALSEAGELNENQASEDELVRKAILKILHQTESCTRCKDHYKKPHKCDMDLAAPRCVKRVRKLEALIRTEKLKLLDKFENDCKYNYTTFGNSEKMLQVSGLLKRIEAERTKLGAEL